MTLEQLALTIIYITLKVRLMKKLTSFILSAFILTSLNATETVSKGNLKELLKRFDYQRQTSLKSFKKIKLSDIKSFDNLSTDPEENKQMKEFREEQERVEKEEGFWKKKYDVYSGNLESINPMDGTPYQNRFYYFKTRKEGKNPLIFLFPVIMGITPVEKFMAAYFARKGMNVLIARLSEDVTDISRPIEDIDGFQIRNAVSARVLYDMAIEFPEVDENRFGAVGSSMGGIRLLIIMGVDKRFKYGVTYVAGGNVPDILTHSEVEEITALRDAKMKELGVDNLNDYKKKLQGVVTIDPLVFARLVNKDNLNMSISKKDKGVPTRNQLEIWNRLGKPRASFLSRGHVYSVITSFLRRKKIRQYFEEKWKNEGATK